MSRVYEHIGLQELAAKVIEAAENHRYFEAPDPEDYDAKPGLDIKRKFPAATYVEEFAHRFPFKHLTKQIEKDLSKVEFDIENMEASRDEGFLAKKLCGFTIVEKDDGNDFCFLGVTAGGDWEQPLFFIIYWDGKQLRGYIPTDGNPWNTDQKSAYGNNDELDIENFKKRYPESRHESYEDCSSEELCDEKKILADIAERIKPKNSSIEIKQKKESLGTFNSYDLDGMTIDECMESISHIKDAVGFDKYDKVTLEKSYSYEGDMDFNIVGYRDETEEEAIERIEKEKEHERRNDVYKENNILIEQVHKLQMENTCLKQGHVWHDASRADASCEFEDGTKIFRCGRCGTEERR